MTDEDGRNQVWGDMIAYHIGELRRIAGVIQSYLLHVDTDLAQILINAGFVERLIMAGETRISLCPREIVLDPDGKLSDEDVYKLVNARVSKGINLVLGNDFLGETGLLIEVSSIEDPLMGKRIVIHVRTRHPAN